MKNRRVVLAILVAVSLILALLYSYRFFRLAIIRETLEWDLPGWLQAIIWGW